MAFSGKKWVQQSLKFEPSADKGFLDYMRDIVSFGCICNLDLDLQFGYTCNPHQVCVFKYIYITLLA